jgi:membrane-associated PAP2 superfamily phosphatase
LALLLVIAYPLTGLDSVLIARYYDTQTLIFPLKNDWFLENVMHLSLKYLMVGVGFLLLGLWLLGLPFRAYGKTFQAKLSWLQNYHRQFIWLFVAMVVSTSAISVLKHFSEHACPWDLVLYGGTQPLIALFGSLPTGARAGHCFPGGHASGGFALMAFYFGFRDTLPKLAKIGLILGLLFGLVMGWSQMMRGAHFMSHNLWTAWIIWMILLVQYLLWSPKVGKAKM